MNDAEEITEARDLGEPETPMTGPQTPKAEPDGPPVEQVPLPATYIHPTQSPAEHSRHSGRFRAAFAALGAVAFVAVLVAVALAVSGGGNGGGTSDPNWSSWRPTATGNAALEQIAARVSPYYRLNATTQIDVVSPVALTDPSDSGVITGKGLTVAINSGGGKGKLETLNGTADAYNLCGTGGKHCEIGGTPSQARMLLLHREALELALYTLEYEPSVEYVIAVMPPGHATTASGKHQVPVTTAVLFSRKQLQMLLNRPLDETLTQVPLDQSELPAWSRTQEAGLVDEITNHWVFSEQVKPDQEGGNLLVLTPETAS